MLVRVSKKHTAVDAAAVAATPSEAIDKLTQATLPELIQTSKGSMWPGKEHVLGCLVRVCETNPHLPDDVFAAVCDILIKQMSYGTVLYQRSVVGHYNTLVSALNPKNIYGDVADTLLGIVQQDTLSRSSAMDVDTDEPMQQPQKLLLVASATKALSLSLPRTRQLLDGEVEQLVSVLQNNARNSVWNVRVASLEALSKLFEHSNMHGNLKVHSSEVLEAIKVCAAEGKYLAVRAAALDALDAFITSIQATPTNDAKKWRLEAFVVLDLLINDPAPSIADRAKELRRQ
ncbi:proteasome component M29 [Coemansia sp. RSA 2607]|nr:proteasome component M29 [Coemansia sp. RSA 2607]